MKPSKRPLRPKMNEFGVGEAETAHNSQNESNGMRSSVNDSSKPAMKSQPFTQQTDYTKPQSRPREEDLPHHQTKSEVVDSKPKGNSYTNSLTSQNHKRKEQSYKITPKMIPRPNHNDEIYKNPDKQPIYNTSEDSLPPHTNSFFIVNETQNSSPRLIRGTFSKIPQDSSILSASGLQFGLVVQPFAEFLPQEREIPKVESPDGIFRCKRCSSYINSKYSIDFDKMNKRIAVCNICSCHNELDSNNPTVKSDYFNNSANVPELCCPTVDFHAPSTMKHNFTFEPHYIFMIDVTQASIDCGVPAYVLNSIQSNLDLIHNAANSHIAIATYNHRVLRFYTYEKDELRAYVVPDCERTYCPLPRNKLFLNVVERRQDIEKLIEKISIAINENHEKANIPGSISGSAIKAGIDALKGNGGRVMIFNCNSCVHGFGFCKPKDDSKLLGTEKEKILYHPQHTQYAKLSEECIQNRVVVDLFSIGNTQFDLATAGQISSLSGGQTFFYPFNLQDIKDFSKRLEKFHYDLSRILTRPNYYDVKFMYRGSIGFEVQEILGSFNRKLGEGFQIAGCDPDFTYAYNMKITESLKADTVYHFQIVCLYLDNFNQRFLRIFNYSLQTTSDISALYYSVDVDSMTRLLIMKELTTICGSSQDKILARENILKKLVECLYYYRTKCSKSTPMQQLILPASVKYLPLLMTSFIKSPVIRKNKSGLSSNYIVSYINRLLREPTHLTIKSLYPRLYRVDDILEGQGKLGLEDLGLNHIGLVDERYGVISKPLRLPLSLDYIDFDSSYLIDDGEFINLFIFNENAEDFYNGVFQVSSFEEINTEIDALDESNESEINKRIINITTQLRIDNLGPQQPIRFYFLNQKSVFRDELTSLLKEDMYKDEAFYVDILADIHSSIQNKMNS